MGRKPTKCPKKCSHHLFSLKPVRYSAYFSREVQVSFCPATLKHHPIHPYFNRDLKHYSPSFTLKEDQVFIFYNLGEIRGQWRHLSGGAQQILPRTTQGEISYGTKLFYLAQAKAQIQVPILPLLQRRILWLFRGYFFEMQHINSQPHIEKLRANKFSEYIHELIQQQTPRPSASFPQ